MNNSQLHIKSIVLFLLLFISITSIKAQSIPLAKNGIINLTEWNFDSTGTTKLHGEWEFYWNKLLIPADFEALIPPKPDYIQVPGLWNTNDKYPAFGYATYRLRIYTNYKKELTIYTLGAATAYKIWINGRFEGEIGKVATSKKDYIPQEKPASFNIYPINSLQKTRKIEIIIQVANFSHSKSGLWENIKIGTTQQITAQNNRRNLWNAFVIGILLIMSLYHFGLSFSKINPQATFYLAIFLFFMAIRNLVTNDQLILNIIPNLSFNAIVRLQFFSAFPNVIFAGMFFYYLFKKHFNKKILWIIISIGGLFSFLILFFSVHFFTTLTSYFGVFLLLASTYFSIVLIKVVKNKEQGAVMAFIGMFAMLITGFSDIITTIFAIPFPYLAPYGVVIFLILQSFIVLQNFANAFDENKKLTERLELNNQNLGRIIEQKTKKLQETVEEIKASEEELTQNNEELLTLNNNLEEQKNIIKLNEKRLQHILNSIGEGVAITDYNENFIYANPAAYSIFEENKESGTLIGRNLSEFIDEDEWTKIVIQTQRRKQNKVNTYELKINLKNGKTKNIVVTAAPDENDSEISATIGVFRDITSRVEKEKEIIHLKNQLEILINNIPAFVYYKDTNMRYISVNKSFSDALNLLPEDLIGKTDSEIAPTKTAKLYEILDKQILRTKKPFLNFEQKHVYPDGTEYWASTSKVPYFDDLGRVIGIIGIVQDITERKLNEIHLNELNNKLSKYYTTIEQSSLSIVFTDTNGILEYANPIFYKQTGYSPNEVIGKNISFLKSKNRDKTIIKKLWETIKAGKTWQGELINVKKDGTQYIEKEIISPIFDQNNEIINFVGIKEDITEFNKAQQIIKEKNEQFTNTINNMVDIYVKCDFKGNFLHVSPSIIEEFNCNSLEEVYKSNIFDWILIDNQQKINFFRTLQKYKLINNFSFVFKRIDRENQYAEINANLFYNKNKAVGFEGIIRNITERIKFEQKLQKQRDIIQEVHNDITASINYAKYIQDALLPQRHIIDSFFKQYFILYLPKHTVSGDFYYFKTINDTTIFAVGDCTGHGVPGAFLTVLSITLLDEIIRHETIFNPANILEELRFRIKNLFSQFGSDNNNGLDIGLCTMNKDKTKLQFSGANNSMYFISNNQLVEYKAIKSPIGFHYNELAFTNYSINIKTNDVIYLYSDGYQDQFSEINFKKFTKKRFRSLLFDIHKYNANKQFEILLNAITTWKGNEEQIDDITVMGVIID